MLHCSTCELPNCVLPVEFHLMVKASSRSRNHKAMRARSLSRRWLRQHH
jgi:hypothetical protein